MKFLNLDLDFFLNEIVHDPPSLGRRAPKRRYKPWPEADLRQFLEQRCGLNRHSRIAGRFGIHHSAVFDYWRCLIVTAPHGTQIDLTHVDAHGDFITWYDKGVSFIRETLLCHQPEDRLYVIDKNPECVTLANYMSFAVACRWIKRIEFVTHPKWNWSWFALGLSMFPPTTSYLPHS